MPVTIPILFRNVLVRVVYWRGPIRLIVCGLALSNVTIAHHRYTEYEERKANPESELSREETCVPNKLTEVLLVEDSLDDAQFTISALKQHHPDIHIEHVQDGPTALDFLFSTGTYKQREPEQTPSLILLDVGLPKVNGLTVLRIIKSYARLRNVPVVVFTSSTDDQMALEAYELGVNSYVHKPINFQQFRQAIQRIGLYWLDMNTTIHSDPRAPSRVAKG